MKIGNSEKETGRLMPIKWQEQDFESVKFLCAHPVCVI
jgi:hypothetical protein